MYIEYDSNNSGGSWWLDDDDWKALEKAGWKVEWVSLENLYTDKGSFVREEDGTPKLVPAGGGNSRFGALMKKPDDNGEYRFLGALANTAYRVGLPLHEAIEEWERVTKACAIDAGCACCGQPHNFTEYDDDNNFVTSGPTTSYTAGW